MINPLGFYLLGIVSGALAVLLAMFLMFLFGGEK